MLDSFRERRPSTASQVLLDEQIDFLQEKLQMIQSQSGYARKRKEKSLRRELTALRRQMRNNERKVSGESARYVGGVACCMGYWEHARVCERLYLSSPPLLPSPLQKQMSRSRPAPPGVTVPPASPAMLRSWPVTCCMGACA